MNFPLCVRVCVMSRVDMKMVVLSFPPRMITRPHFGWYTPIGRDGCHADRAHPTLILCDLMGKIASLSLSISLSLSLSPCEITILPPILYFHNLEGKCTKAYNFRICVSMH